MDKLIIVLRKVFSSLYRLNIRFDLKRNNDFLIWDSELSDEIKLLIGNNYSVQVIERRQKIDLPISLGFFLYLFKSIITGKFLPIPYIVASYLSPKILITHIDNSLNFKKIKLLNSSIRVISIQNGIRYDFMMNKFIDFEFDVYLGFGDVENQIINNAGIIVKKYYSTGALALCDKNVYKKIEEYKYDIVFISDIISADFHSKNLNNNYKSFYYFYEKYTKIICEYLNIIARENCLNIAVAMRSNNLDAAHKIETLLYKPFGYLKCIPRIEKSSYQLCFNSKLITTIGSTLGYEMLGLNKKVLFCNGIDEISRSSYRSPFTNNPYVDNLHHHYIVKDFDIISFREKILFLLEKSLDHHLVDSNIMKLKYMNFISPERYKLVFKELVKELIG